MDSKDRTFNPGSSPIADPSPPPPPPPPPSPPTQVPGFPNGAEAREEAQPGDGYGYGYGGRGVKEAEEAKEEEKGCQDEVAEKGEEPAGSSAGAGEGARHGDEEEGEGSKQRKDGRREEAEAEAEAEEGSKERKDGRRGEEETKGGGGGGGGDEGGDGDGDDIADDVFEIPAKNRPAIALRRWKNATLVLNAARRFRYTEDIERMNRLRRFRATLQAIRAANRFQSLLKESPYPSPSPSPSPAATKISAELLASILQSRSSEQIQREFGGIDRLSHLLGTSPEKGLIDDDPSHVQKIRDEFGSNTYTRQPSKSFLGFVLDACKDPTLIVLMVCASLSLAFGIKSHGFKEGWYDGISIAFAVLLVVLVTSVSDYRQSLQFATLNEEKQNIQVDVVRGGKRMKISIFEIVLGDLVLLHIGDQVPADGLFVYGHALSLDESSMTGESEPVHVHQKSPFLMSGCKVCDGEGKMLVTGVGMRTEWGQLMAQLGEDAGEETPLQVRLNGVATFIGKIGLAVAVIVFIILFIFYFVGHKEGSNQSGKFKAGRTPSSAVLNTVVDIFAIAVTIIVVAVPEGLPLSVTLSLAYAMKKMMADRALVRRLSACETMGSATTICTDKTGTLTLNQMTVVKAWVAGEFRGDDLQSLPIYGLLLEGIAQNSSASVNTPGTEEEEEEEEQGKGKGGVEVIGSPTEKAILSWGLMLGMSFDAVRSSSSVLQVETFNSAKKRAGVAVKARDTGRIRAHWKGAAEIVLQESATVLAADNSTVPISESMRSELANVIDGMAGQSLRCIALGYRELDGCDVPEGSAEEMERWKIPEGPLTLVAIVGIKDPCRPGVMEAVRSCQNAGIVVRMVTGDNLATAKAIATECGILTPGSVAIEGPAFRELGDEARRKEVVKISVLARSSPSDKLLVVRTLRELGEVVAVTGDGTNDAPALHEADIGLSMGIQGTEVAKESSDIIILDDDFASVVKVVRWGRSIYSNIQKFIQFQLTVNVAALTVNFVAALSSGDVPLTAVQLLWVNLIMDTLGALALATESPTDELLRRPPVGRKDPLVSNVMARNLAVQALYQIALLLVLQFRGKQLLNLAGPDAQQVNNTLIFNAFVLCQLFNEVNARKPEELNIFAGLLANPLFVAILVATSALQVVIVELLNKFASTVKLSWQHWLLCVGIGFVSWPIALVGKLIPVPKKPLFGSPSAAAAAGSSTSGSQQPQPS